MPDRIGMPFATLTGKQTGINQFNSTTITINQTITGGDDHVD
jgi:hypothetical protein